LFALDRVLASSRVRDAALLGVGFALQALTSVYLLVFTTWMLIFAAAARGREWLGRGRLRNAGLLAAAGTIGVAILTPYLMAYAEVHRLQGFERSLEETRTYVGSWRDYLATGGRFYYSWWSQPFVDQAHSDNFPGITAALLALLAALWPETRTDRRLLMCTAAAAGCVSVALVPAAPFYPLLYRYVPLFHVVRLGAHIGQIVLLMIAVAAGFGLSGLLRRSASRRVRIALALAALALVNLEALRAPLDYEPFSAIPHVYNRLATEPNAVVIEIPMWEPRLFFGNATYMLNSTRHWRPLLNGYSGFRPQSYDDTFQHMSGFPDFDSLNTLRSRGVTHVVVHRDQMHADRAESLSHIASLQLLGKESDIEIYRLR
jgi:hypothetical protein